MDNNTNEIVGSQLGGALLAGCRVTPEYLTELKENINIVRDVASEYCTLTIKDKNTRVYFVAYFTRLLKKVNGMLPKLMSGELKVENVTFKKKVFAI